MWPLNIMEGAAYMSLMQSFLLHDAFILMRIHKQSFVLSVHRYSMNYCLETDCSVLSSKTCKSTRGVSLAVRSVGVLRLLVRDSECRESTRKIEFPFRFLMFGLWGQHGPSEELMFPFLVTEEELAAEKQWGPRTSNTNLKEVITNHVLISVSILNVTEDLEMWLWDLSSPNLKISQTYELPVPNGHMTSLVTHTQLKP